MMLGLIGSACEKELSRAVKQDDKPQVTIDLSDPEGNSDGSAAEDGLEGLSEIERNDHSVYTFGGVRGTYFGCISSFRGEKDVNLEITLGTSLTPNTMFSQKEFELLIRAGERQFGSLGSFGSFPVIDSGLVEIAFTDKHNRQWCSTQITGQNSETTVKVEQRRAVFMIEDVHKLEIGPESEGYRIRGYFDCMMYEVNGKAKKKIKGSFSGIVAPR